MLLWPLRDLFYASELKSLSSPSWGSALRKKEREKCIGIGGEKIALWGSREMTVSYNELKGCHALLKGIGIEQDSATKLEGLALEFQASMTAA